MPRVSVIMPARDAAPYVQAALDSLSRQTLGDFEALVIDDASQDATGAIARAHAARDPRFRVLAGEGAGVSAARNIGLAASTGRLVAFLDADDVALEDSLAQRARLLGSDPQAQLVSCGWNVIGPEGEDLGLHMGRIAGPRGFDTAFDLPVHIGAVMGDGALLRRFRFDPALSHGEDHHYLLQILRAGAVLHAHPDVVLHYRWRRGAATEAITRHQLALVDLLDAFAAPAPGGWPLASVRPRQLWLLYDLAARLVMRDAASVEIERAAQRCDALVAHAGDAPAQFDARAFWIGAVRAFLQPRESAALSESVCSCAGGLLALADRLAAHASFAAATRGFIDDALARALQPAA